MTDTSMPARTSAAAGRAAALRWRRRGPAVGPARIPSGLVPLSDTQRAILLFEHLHSGTCVKNLTCRLAITGPLDVAVLETALASVVASHDALRAVVVADDAAFRVLPESRVALEVADLCSFGADGAAEAERLALASAASPFDLGRGPLLRALLLRLGDQSALLVCTVHHLVVTGGALGPLIDALVSAYQAGGSSRPGRVPLSGDGASPDPQAMAEGREFWRRRLADLAPLDLPYDRAPTGGRGYRSGGAAIELGRPLSDAVRALAAAEGTTAFTVLCAGLQALLGRVAGQEDVVVGAPMTHGPDPAAGVNMVALRSAVRGGLSFREHLRRVRATCLEAMVHRGVPLEVAGVGGPLVQVILTLQSRPQARRVGAVEFEMVAAGPAATQYELELSLWLGATIAGTVQYDADLFELATVERLLAQLATLLEAATGDPDHPLAELDLLPPEQVRQLAEFSRGPRMALPERSITELIAGQARLRPDQVAVFDARRSLTYRELDLRANRLAHHLAASGVGPDSVVAICLPRTPDLVVSVLAILKSGAAYLPLDPAYPPERLSFMLADSRAAHLITHPDTPPPSHPVPTTDVTAVQLDHLPSSQPPTRHHLDNLCYLIYTSGSTGIPKGVAVSHRAVLRLMFGMDVIPMGPDDVLLHVTPTSFDVSTFDLWTPLVHGGHLALLPAGVTGPDEVASTIGETQTSVVFLTTQLANAIVDQDPHLLAPLHTLVIGGEALSLPHVRRLLRQLPGLSVVNGYGPAESTTYTSLFRVPLDLPDHHSSVPIGHPVGNTDVHVLDGELRQVPLGVAGELCIGGLGLARGYLHRPGLTAERFVPDPFSGLGARMYRTGDLVRWLPDGDLEFLGRRDHQVKIRGHRIELGEVEHVLRSLPDVADAVVLAREEQPGDRRLAAYLTVTSDDEDLVAGVREGLRARLPSYMVPSSFTVLDAFPLTANGKVDRDALPDPDPTLPARFTPPRTALEQRVAAVWQEVLGPRPVGVHDDFFELGGHSLLATRVVSRLRTSLDREVQLRWAFEHPTVAELAACLATQDSAAASSVPLEPRARSEESPPASFGQQRLWFLSELDPQAHLAYHMLGGAHTRGPLDAAALEHALTEVVARHEVLRTSFALHDDGLRQVVHPPQPFPLPVIDVPAGEVDQFIAAETAVPFDLAAGPLVRARLLRTGELDHTLVVALHHTIADGWSLAVLLQEVAAAYHAHLNGSTPQLPPLPLQYADYALWLRQREAAGELQHQLDYWRSQLAGLQPIDLPTDHPRPAAQTFTGASLPVHLSQELVQRLARLARQEHATLHMALTALLGALLHRLSADTDTDIPIGTPVAGRQHPDLENLIGFFVNTLVIRTDLSQRPSFRLLLQQVRDTCLDAHANQDVPFERLVEELRPNRQAANPLFQVMLALHNQPFAPLHLPDLELSPLLVEAPTTQFDLHLALSPQPDDSLSGTLQYNRDLFERATVERLLEQLATLLEAATGDPDRPLAELDLLPPEQVRQLAEFSRGPRMALPERSITELIAGQARLRPDQVAVFDAHRSLTYRQLDLRANRLAHHLAASGVGPDSVVAICLPRTPDLVVSVLAILKSGAAYLPLDPAYPPERLSFMLADSRAAHLITHPDTPPPSHPVPTTDIATVQLDHLPGSPPPTRHHLDNLCYLIYTSGSTGTPKGVAVSHRSLANLLCSMDALLGIGATDTIGAITTLSFDIAALELYLPLLAGASMALIDRDTTLDPQALIARLDEAKVTFLQSTPRIWQGLCDSGWRPARPLQAVTGGEALPRPLAARLGDVAADAWNVYGPTETTVWSTAWHLPAAMISARSLPIGGPIHNTDVHVLDRGLGRVPVGVAGQLCIGGLGLARGYLHRPGLTAERFVPDPFSEPGARMYRTGDLVRWLPDGNLEFLGRSDHQVKIRGHRIELGEVEHVLRSLPGVADAVATVREDPAGDRRLAAYVAADVSQHVTPADADEQVREWAEVWDASYTSGGPERPFGSDFSGWNSSYDGRPIPIEQMEEWRRATVARVRSLRPRRVLEIGVGNGLLLSRLAPDCESYVGTDLSRPAISGLEAQVAGRPDLAGRVRLHHRPAEHLDDLADEPFDVVVLNSVIQFFPDSAYLLAVLRTALGLLASGGAVFVGDVRNLRLHRAFHAGVLLAGSEATASAAGMRHALDLAVLREKELLVDPEWFVALPNVAAVDVQVKRGRHVNELSRYRYDVVLRKGPVQALDVSGVPRLVWGVDVDRIDAALSDRDRPLRLAGIPNGRVSADLAALHALESGRHRQEVARAAERAGGVDVEALAAAAERAGRRPLLTWSVADPGAVDLVILPDRATAPVHGTYEGPGTLDQRCSNPAAARRTATLARDLRARLEGLLPDHLVPSTFVVVDKFPRTPNGKLDLAALPDPELGVRTSQRPPATPVEHLLCGIVAKMLGLPSVGVDENFFHIGGHSLLVARVTNRVRAETGVELPLRLVFEHPTIADLAKHVASATDDERPAIRRHPRVLGGARAAR